MSTSHSIPIIILAAGASRRLGSPKQLVTYRDISLLRHITQEAIDSQMGPVHVIIGAYPHLSLEVHDLDCTVAHHRSWAAGMGSSIAFGIGQIDPLSHGVIISTSDQPYLSAALYRQLDGSAEIILSKYDEGAGPPSYFSAVFYDELSQLRGDAGAKAIVARHIHRVQYIDFPEGNIDIDTVEDIENL